MTTFQDAINETRNHLMTGQPDRLNVLDAGIDALPTTVVLTLTYPLDAVAPGTQMSVGLEEMHVISSSGSTVTVMRGANGSTISAHSAGDTVRINPQFSDARIAKQLNHSILALNSEGLFRILSEEFTYTPARSGYNLDLPNLIDVWRVTYDYPGPQRDWPILDQQDWKLNQNPDTSDFPGGNQLVLRQGGYPGFPVRVSYKATFSTLTNLSDTLETTAGLPFSSHELPPLGAAIRVLAGRDVKRTFLDRQPEPRRQEEVPPGSATQAIGALAQAYYSGIDRELKALYQRYPIQL